MKSIYDVIVVGAGPAGATVAYEMAGKGYDVLLIEREVLPRYKCCAGGITVRTAKLLGFDLSHLVENTVTGARIDFNGKASFTGTWRDAIVYTVNRDVFDYELVKRAKNAGVTILEGLTVTEVRNLDDSMEVVTSSGSYKGAFLVGADGAHSIVAKKTGMAGQRDYIVGINNEIEIPSADLSVWNSCIRADIGCIRAGYGWVFPKHDHLSIGIATLSRVKARGLREAYELFEKSLSLNHAGVRKRSGHIIPVIRRDQLLYSDRVVLTGDAAGLADPLTGEGIYSAVWSGLLASQALEAALHYGKQKLAGYQNAAASAIFPELRIARVLRNLFIHFPSAVFKVLKSEEILWRGGCRLARGEIDYTFARQRIGGYKQMYAYLLNAIKG